MIRVGLVGTESSHADHFVRHLVTESRSPGVTISAALAQEPERDAQFEAAGLRIIDAFDDLLEAVDAVLITTRDGDRHAELAAAALAAGKAALADKPLATEPQAADRLVAAAEARGLRLWSASALRFHPLVAQARDALPRLIEVTGPAQPDCPHAGLFFYGTHPAEAACAIALGRGPGRPTGIEVTRPPGEVVINAELSGARLRVRLFDAAPGTHEFTLAHGDEHLGAPVELRMATDYLAPVTASMVEALEATRAPELLPALGAVDLLAAARQVPAREKTSRA